MDPTMLAIMAFFLIAIILTGTFVLLIPVSRQLAKFMEFRMRDKTAVPANLEAELRELRALVDAHDLKLHSLNDRQEFIEKVLDARSQDPLQLPRSH
jgi:hypothetical protein